MNTVTRQQHMRRARAWGRNTFIGTTLSVLLLSAVCFTVACEPPDLQEYQESLLRGESSPAASETPGEDESLVLATIDGDPITLADFQRRVGALEPEDQRRVSSEAARRRVLSAIIDMHLFAAEAVDMGLANDPMVEQAERSAIRHIVLERMLAPQLPAPSNISEIEVRHIFREESFRFRRPELARVGLIVTPERSVASSLLREYQQRLGRDIQSSLALFERLAAEHSIVPQQAVDLGFVSRASLSEVAHDEVVEAVFALNNPGRSTDIIAVSGGWALFVLIEQRRALGQDMDEVAESIREQAVAGRRVLLTDRLVSGLRDDAQIEIDRELLSRLESAAATARPTPARQAWESRSAQELEAALTPQHDLTFLGDLLLRPREEFPPDEVTDGDEGE